MADQIAADPEPLIAIPGLQFETPKLHIASPERVPGPGRHVDWRAIGAWGMTVTRWRAVGWTATESHDARRQAP